MPFNKTLATAAGLKAMHASSNLDAYLYLVAYNNQKIQNVVAIVTLQM